MEPSSPSGRKLEPEPGRIGLPAIARTFGLLGLTAFGSGLSAYVRQVIVRSRGWLSDPEFIEGLEISQIVPGPNVLNLTTFIGDRLRGATGAAVAIAFFIAPGLVAIIVLAALYFENGSLPNVVTVLKGIGAAAAGLSLANTLQIGKKEMAGVADFVLAAVTFVAVAVFHVSLLIALLVLGAAGIWLNRPGRAAPHHPALTSPERDI